MTYFNKSGTIELREQERISIICGKCNIMDTIIQKIEKEQWKEEHFKTAIHILQSGGLVAFPTETVYGLGANALDEQAAKKIYKAKGRPSDNPLIVHIAHINALYELTAKISEKALRLAEVFWPGPLTMIFPKSSIIPFSTTGGLDTVAIRFPNHDIARALITYSGLYLAAPSANLSGRPSPTKASHVIEDMQGKIDMIIDGGDVGIGIESTILDMTEEIPVILRPGYITKSKIEQIIGEVIIDKAILTTEEKGLIPKAPGMKYKHYAPQGELTIVEGNIKRVIERINQEAEKKTAAGNKVGIIATTETKAFYKIGEVRCIGSREKEESIARGLYTVLREFDSIGAQYIYTESFQSDKLGQAIMNRLLKAAGHQLIKVE